jgi:3-deoxy-D-manno-octulosonic-acid transferase
VAYIGGGFGVGIHNTQEASAFGLPVIFGPNYKKFQEAIDLVEAGASFSIKDLQELTERFHYLENNEVRNKLSVIAKDYVAGKAGATRIILNYFEEKGLLKL